MDTNALDSKLLFGASFGWHAADWVASDDRVRGGASLSYLSCSSSDHNAKFYGNLDIDTLGGAGFASQRTTDDDLSLDLSGFDGIELNISGADLNQYTFILKDTLLNQSENGREQASVSYEYNFSAPYPFSTGSAMTLRAPWSAFQPTFRGKLKKDAEPLKKDSVKRLSIMIRSFFGSQKGEFALTLRSISAYKGSEDPVRDWKPEERSDFLRRLETLDDQCKLAFPFPYRDHPVYEQTKELEGQCDAQADPGKDSTWICGLCG